MKIIIDDKTYTLIPLADEPKPEPTAEHIAELRQCIYSLEDSIKILDAKLHEVKKDAIARVNGLRADYLADQSAVQPSRVDALEERLNKFDDKFIELADDVNLDLREQVADQNRRLEALESTLTECEEGKYTSLARVCQRLNALEQRAQPSDTKILEAAQALVNAIASQVNTNLSWKDVNLNLLVPGYLLEGVRPLFKKGTQTSDAGAGVKGVWVTAEQFWDAWCEVNPIGLTSEEVYRRIAKRLGLEE